MVLVAASLVGALFRSRISGPESAIGGAHGADLPDPVQRRSMRLRDRTDVGSQITDLSRGTADLARQVAEFGRRLAAVEGRVVSANSAGSDRIHAVVNEISELGGWSSSSPPRVAGHEDVLAAMQANAASAPEAAPEKDGPDIEPHREPRLFLRLPASRARGPGAAAVTAGESAPSRSQSQLLATVRSAIEENRIDIFLQPMVTAAQRQGAFTSGDALRDDKDRFSPPRISSPSRKPRAWSGASTTW